MNITRKIREEEVLLIKHLLEHLGMSEKQFPIASEVHEYEGGIMGSINLVNPDAGDYDGDLIRVEYTDSDKVPVMISLTKDQNNQLLDLDFWKEDFSKLIEYPKPEQVVFA